MKKINDDRIVDEKFFDEMNKICQQNSWRKYTKYTQQLMKNIFDENHLRWKQS